MSALVKAGHAARAEPLVRPLQLARSGRGAAVAPVVPADPRIAALEAELADARAERETAAAAVSALTEERDAARAAGVCEGREAAAGEFEEREAERLALLEAGIAVAIERFERALGALEALAGALACEAVEKIVGGDPERSALVLAALRAQLDAIDQSCVVGVELSADDFSDAAALEAVLARPGLDIAAVAARASGDCIIALRLGQIECGLDRQLERLRSLLDPFAEERPA